MPAITDEDVLKQVELNFESFVKIWTRFLPIFAVLAYALFYGYETGEFLRFKFDIAVLAYIGLSILAGIYLFAARCLATIISLIEHSNNQSRIIFFIRNHPSITNPFFGQFKYGYRIPLLDIAKSSVDLHSKLFALWNYMAFASRPLLIYSGIISLNFILVVCGQTINVILSPMYYSALLEGRIVDSLTKYEPTSIIHNILGLVMMLFFVVFVVFLARSTIVICRDDYKIRFGIWIGSFVLFICIFLVAVGLSGITQRT